jgi:hypothetical protein
MKKAADINTMIPNTILNPGVIGVDSDVAICDVFDGLGDVASDCTSGTFGVRFGVDGFLVRLKRVMRGRSDSTDERVIPLYSTPVYLATAAGSSISSHVFILMI